MSRIHQFWKRTVAVVNRIAIWSDRHLPRGVRAGLGVLAMAGGVVGFLPVRAVSRETVAELQGR